MNEMLSINRNIASSVRIPVFTDIDNAYGDVDHVKVVIHSLNEIGVSGAALHPNSIIPLLRSLLDKASIDGVTQYSSHSFDEVLRPGRVTTFGI